ncbi:DHA2 family methylenomycin A resistance protein-like MFS transporter [Thermosporothrix hazakensis]|jgi:DHA2 family methylenomycin A resistance protein-like MFS transporter|uniref:DHA2 family methylenomycin A resistance protein-like MFS transporter n=1 Tax=Thermosporothrix hazakensis TaxID=644383 RepID=A0A326TRY0_THEHA|nr:MFS transporter [Thermosporothrix hazakensis]PZW19508.1 DHA2 family methylenomycin A resistance protein-like MFS transporter [Thermosporothrix hazakensis]GCE47581.1 MFS transporter [Thermosporothrix hazakensis]
MTGLQKTRVAGIAPLIAVCTGYFMVILDTTIVNVALENMRLQLHADPLARTWLVDGYSLILASLLLSAGLLGDRFGNRRIFSAGLLLFTLASTLCGLAPSLWMLQAARVLQGVGAALLLPSSLALLNQIFTTPKSRARAIGAWGAIAGIAAATGPVLGGFLVQMLSWRGIFLVNVPIGLLGLLLTLRVLPPGRANRQQSFDPGAQVTGCLALGLLTFLLIEGRHLGWLNPLIVGSLAAAVLATLLFLLIEKRVSRPMLPLALFQRPAFSFTTLLGLLLNFSFYGELFVLNLYFAQVQQLDAFHTGLAVLPQVGMALIGSSLAGRVTGRYGPHLPMFLGLLSAALGFLALSIAQAHTPYWLLCLPMLAIGFGTSFTMPAMTTACIAAAPEERSGIAAAVLNASRQVGSVLGVALLGMLVGVAEKGAFLAGMHTALWLACGAYLLGLLCVQASKARGEEGLQSSHSMKDNADERNSIARNHH